MGLKEAVRTCFSKFATFEGRARRAEFWMFYLFLQIVGIVGYVLILIVAMVAGFLPLMLGGASEEAMVAGFGMGMAAVLVVFGLYILVMLALTIPYLAVAARRLHDMGQTGHWLWLSLAGLSIVPLIMAFFDSQWGANQWGPDPKADERARYPQPQQYGYAAAPQYGQAPQPYGQTPQNYGQQAPQPGLPAGPADPFQQPPTPPQPPAQ